MTGQGDGQGWFWHCRKTSVFSVHCMQAQDVYNGKFKSFKINVLPECLRLLQ